MVLARVAVLLVGISTQQGGTGGRAPSASLLAFVQYDNESERVDFNVRFHWIPVIGDDCYLVWNSGHTTDPEAPFRFPNARALAHPLNGAFVVKLVHRLTP